MPGSTRNRPTFTASKRGTTGPHAYALAAHDLVMTNPFYAHVDLRSDPIFSGAVFEVAGTNYGSDYLLTVSTDGPNLTGDRARSAVTENIDAVSRR